MKTWQDQQYMDDRLFVLDLQPATKAGRSVWAVTTRRNVEGFPPRRVDDFETKEQAIVYLKHVEPSTPRISLGGASPSPQPTYEEYLAWCKAEDIPDSIQLHKLWRNQQRAELIIEEVDPEELAGHEIG